MKFYILAFLTFLLFFKIITVTESAVAIIGPNPLAAEKGGHCYDNSVGPMAKGERKKVKNQCTEAVCRDDHSISLLGCGVFAVPSTCKIIEEDVTKPYPDCCRHPQC